MGLTESFDNDWRVCDSCQNSPSRESHAALSSSAVEHLHLQWSLVRLIPFTLGSGNSTSQKNDYVSSDFVSKENFLKGLISLLIYVVPFWALCPSRRSSYPEKTLSSPSDHPHFCFVLSWSYSQCSTNELKKKHESIKALRK